MLDLIEPTPTVEPLLLDARSAAKSLSISERTLWTFTKKGDIPCIRIGKRVLYSPDDLRTWIDRRKNN